MAEKYKGLEASFQGQYPWRDPKVFHGRDPFGWQTVAVTETLRLKMAKTLGHHGAVDPYTIGEALRCGGQDRRSFRPNGQSTQPFVPWQIGQ